MIVQEVNYSQEILILAYIYMHPNEIEKVQMNVFKNVTTMQLFKLMKANYNFNDKQCINSTQIIDAMVKNKNFQKLLDEHDLILRVFSGQEAYIITKSIFDGYLKGRISK